VSAVTAAAPPGWLRARLATPAARAGLPALAEGFFHGIVRVEARAGAPFANDPALPGRLRGALGRVLLRSASPEARAERPCPWTPPCALDVLMGRHGEAEPGLAIPPPWVLRARAAGPGLVVELVLFGFATDWIEAAAEALVTALREGEVLGPGAALEPAARTVAMLDGLPAPAPAPTTRAALLEFETPLSLRSGPVGAAGPTSLLPSLLRRLAGLARWQDADLAREERDGLAAAARRLRVTCLDQRAQASWLRRSARQRRTVPVDPVGMPVVLLEGELAPLLPALALGELCHVGARASLGLGRYRLHTSPGGTSVWSNNS
jgi:hypothetical protein